MTGNLPLALVGLGLFLLLFAALEIGFRLARRRRSEDEKDGGDFLASAAMGLLALLLGFTFSLALQRHEERRALVIAEANAIGTSWLRIQAIDAGDRDRIADPFRTYAHTRLAWSLTSDEGAGSALLYARAAAQQQGVWNAVIAALANGEAVVDNKLILDPLNQAFDLATTREELRQSHLPLSLMTMLIIYMLFATALVGWRLGEVGRRLMVPAVLTIALLTLAVVITIDLDQGRTGTITVSQRAMERAIGPIMASDPERP